jgi:hypothetical protein
LFFLLWGCKPLNFFSPFSSSSIGDPVNSSMIGCKKVSSGRASQDTTISGSCQQALLDIQSSVWFCDCIWDGFPGGVSLDDLFFSLCSTLCLCISSHGYFLFQRPIKAQGLSLPAAWGSRFRTLSNFSSTMSPFMWSFFSSWGYWTKLWNFKKSPIKCVLL